MDPLNFLGYSGSSCCCCCCCCVDDADRSDDLLPFVSRTAKLCRRVDLGRTRGDAETGDAFNGGVTTVVDDGAFNDARLEVEMPKWLCPFVLLVEMDFLGGVTTLASADDDEDELIGIGVVLADDMDILFLVLVIRFVLTVALMEGDLGVLFAFAFGIVSLMGSTFMGGNCSEVTLGGFARLPGSV